MNTWLFVRIEHLAGRTPWAHAVMRALAGNVGLILLVVLLVAGLAHARLRRSARSSVSGLAASAGAVVLALGAGLLLSHVVTRPRPFDALSGVVLLAGRPGGSPLPDLHATLAGTVVVLLLLAGETALGAVSAVVALLVALAGVYVGTHFPSDAAAGLLLGAVVAGVLVPLARRQQAPAHRGAHHATPAQIRHVPSLSAELAALNRPTSSGPAAQPVPIAASGSVRLLEASGLRAGVTPARAQRHDPIDAGPPAAVRAGAVGDSLNAAGDRRTLRAAAPAVVDPAEPPVHSVGIFPAPPQRPARD